MERLAILGGRDWVDASVDFVNVPDGFDLDKARSAYKAFAEENGAKTRAWYKRNPNWNKGEKNPNDPYPSYKTFVEWLLEFGGASESDVIQIWED